MTTTKTIKKPLVWACVVVIAMLLLAAGVWGDMYYANNVQIDSIISIDVNPSRDHCQQAGYSARS